MPTKIEWSDEVLNPIVGCTKCSPACLNCYAERQAQRLVNMGCERYNPVVEDWKWTGKLNFVPSELDKPAGWKKPRRIFVCSMGDLFHEDVEPQWIDWIIAKAWVAPQHTYLLLTKRPENMRLYFYAVLKTDRLQREIHRIQYWKKQMVDIEMPNNIHLGVTVWNQESADRNIPILLSIPAAYKFVSIEPMLGPIRITPMIGYNAYRCKCGWHDTEYDLFLMGAKNPTARCKKCGENAEIYRALNQVICGAENGPGARHFDIQWARDLRDQCVDANTSFFFKGYNVNGKKTRLLDGREWNEM